MFGNKIPGRFVSRWYQSVDHDFDCIHDNHFHQILHQIATKVLQFPQSLTSHNTSAHLLDYTSKTKSHSYYIPSTTHTTSITKAFSFFKNF